MAKRSREPFYKTRKMNDGELISLLISSSDKRLDSFDSQAYDELKRLSDDLKKAQSILAIAYFAAMLSYFNVVSSVSASGIGISPSGIKHVILIFLSISILNTAQKGTKVTYTQSWFVQKFDDQSPSERARLLILYPEAFGVFKFIPYAIGLPRFVHHNSNIWAIKNLALIILSLVTITAIVVAALSIWILLANAVWVSEFPIPLASKSLVIACGVFVTLAMLMPGFHSFRKSYQHYGMSDVITRIQDENPDRAKHFHRMINEVRSRD